MAALGWGACSTTTIVGRPEAAKTSLMESTSVLWQDHAAPQPEPELWERIGGLALKLTEVEIRQNSRQDRYALAANYDCFQFLGHYFSS